MRTQNLKWAILAWPALSLSLGSCGESDCAEETAINLDSVRTELQALEDAYAAGLTANDVNAVAAYYADDAQSLADHEPTRVGIAAIKAGIQKDIEDEVADSTNHTVSFAVTGVWASGDLAVETGTSTVKDADGNVVETGKYMTLFQKRGDTYIAIRDIWNEDEEDDDDEDADEEDDD